MDQGRVVSWSLPAQPRGGLNDGFGELLKFRPSSQLPKAWIWRCMWYNAHIFLAVLWLCRNWLPSPGVTCSASRRKAFLQEALQCLAPPHQVGCTLIVLAASVPLLVWLNLWPPIVFPFALFFFFFIPPGSTTLPPGLLMPLDHSTCMSSFGHPVSVEAGGLREALGWGKEGREKE